MNYTDFRENAKRTLVSLPSKELDIQHMVVGMATEIGELFDAHKKNFAYGKELDLVNIKEEIGDFFWYVANLDNILNNEMQNSIFNIEEHPPTKNVLYNLSIAQIYVSESIAIVTKEVKNENYELHIASIVRESVGCVLSYVSHFSFDLFEIFDLNVNKLKARYPDKFTQKNALERNLQKEREILENK